MKVFNINIDFPVEITVHSFQNCICDVTETKLLGVILTDDLRWAANTICICTRAYKNFGFCADF